MRAVWRESSCKDQPIVAVVGARNASRPNTSAQLMAAHIRMLCPVWPQRLWPRRALRCYGWLAWRLLADGGHSRWLPSSGHCRISCNLPFCPAFQGCDYQNSQLTRKGRPLAMNATRSHEPNGLMCETLYNYLQLPAGIGYPESTTPNHLNLFRG